MGKWLLVCLVGTVAVSNAFASFELLHMVDRVNNRVVRFDPVNRVTLGSYGAGYFGNAYSISTVNNRSMVWDSGQSRIFVFDAGTGNLERQIPTSSPSGIMWETRLGGAFAPTGNSPIPLIRPDGAVAGTLPGWGAEYKPVAENDSHYFVFSASTNEMRRYRKTDLVQDLSWVNPSLGGGFTSWDTTTATFNGTLRMVLPERFGNRLRLLDVQTGGAQTFTLALENVTGVATGHGNMLYISGVAAGGLTRIIRFNPETQFSSVIYEVPVASQSIESMSIVIAPEPGVWATMGLGMVALIGRRRRK